VTCRTLIDRISRRLAAESGTALVLALSVMGSLAIGGGSVAYYTSQNIGSAGRSSNDMSAMSLAEAGLNDAYSTLYNASNPWNGDSVPNRTVTMGAGTVTYSGRLVGGTWTLTGTGSIVNPTGPSSEMLSRTVTKSVNVVNTQTPDLTVWKYLYSDTTVGCMNINNNAVIGAPLYLRGSLCLGNNSQMNAPLEVGGTLTLNNGAHVGTAGSPVSEVDVSGGCTNGHTALHPCGQADGIYANQIGTTIPSFNKPPVDLAGWYQNAMPGPRHPCTTGSFPGGFDNDGVMNTSMASVNLTPASAYDCQVRDGSGNLLGRIAWTPGFPGTLNVAGTIYFDGNILMQNNISLVYHGKATIYATGTIMLNNNVFFCGVAGCSGSWNPDANLIVFVAGAPSGTGFTISNNSVFQGGAYVVADYATINNGVNWGPVIANQLHISNNAGQVIPLDSLPAGAPANMTTTTTLQQTPSWQG
jgi:hypothetical protein